MPKAAARTTTRQSAIVAVVGSDENEIKAAALSHAATMTPAEAGEFGSDIIDGAADTVDQAVNRIHSTIDALLTIPFFGGEKLVWLKNATFFADSVTGRSQTVLDSAEKLLEILKKGLPEGIRFLLSAIDIDKRRSFYKTLSKIAAVEVYDQIDTGKSGWEEEAAQIVADRAAARGLSFQGDALDLFTQFTGGDKRQIEAELEKLDLYLQPRRPATEADVRILVPMSRAGVVFELGNTIARRDVAASFALIDQLIKQGDSAISLMLITIIPTIRNLLLVKDLMERHKIRPPQKAWFFGSTLDKLPPSATEHLPRKKDGGISAYPLGIAACSAQLFTTDELRTLLECALEANIQLVSSSLDSRVVLGKLIARLAKPPKSTARVEKRFA